MSVQNPLPIPVVQMGHVEKLVEMAQNQPHVQQQVAHETARKELKKAGERVPPTEKTADTASISVDRDGHQGNAQQGKGGKKEAKSAEGHDVDEAADEAVRSSGDPFTGNILNLKI